MSRGIPKPRAGKGLTAWRSRQEPGAIMKSSTFQAIERKAAAAGATSPEKVAGAAYWKTAKAKYGAHHSAPSNPKFDNPDKY